MAAALPAPGTVPGLERLLQLDTVNIHQTNSGYNGNNYTVYSQNEVLFTMDEEVPDSFFRGGAKRSFIFDGVENTGRKVFRFRRPPGGLFFISEIVELYMNEQLASVIRMERTCKPLFTVNTPQQELVIRLKGKISAMAVFEMQTRDKAPMGSIHKLWRGWKQEILNSRNNDFIINFPADLALQYKLGVIVACVLIDFAYFEGK